MNTVLKTYDGELIRPLGVFKPTVDYTDKCFKCRILGIRKGGVRPLVGWDFSRIVNPSLDGSFINNLSKNVGEVKELLSEFKGLFGSDLGCCKFGTVKIELKDPNCKPDFVSRVQYRWHSKKNSRRCYVVQLNRECLKIYLKKKKFIV